MRPRSAGGRAIGKLSRTIPATIGIVEGFDVGSPVDFSYNPPFRFTGTINRAVVDLK